jgi:hypothetical protein
MYYKSARAAGFMATDASSKAGDSFSRIELNVQVHESQPNPEYSVIANCDCFNC